MEKLNFQDAAFLRLESPERPFHVGGLLIFSLPPDAPANYLRKLAARLSRQLPGFDPVFRKKLDLTKPSEPRWLEATDYDPAYHLYHYALPQPGRLEDLLVLLSRVHERLLDRSRPLWEWHLIEGLAGDRFAVYCKMHHALIDGVGAWRVLRSLLADSPRTAPATTRKTAQQVVPSRIEPHSWLGDLYHTAEAFLAQGRALPELAAMLLRMRSEQAAASPPLPFTAPHAIMNTEISNRRRVITASFPLASLRRIGKIVDGTVNDVLLAICGGALRSYLLEQHRLPSKTLLAGVPVSVKTSGESHGNQLSTIVCPLGTTTRDPLTRLRNISRITRCAKRDVKNLSQTARQDYMNLVLLPTVVLTLAHAATLIPPAFNVIVSNVPGPDRPLYLSGSKLQEIYPLSVVTDAQALNITAVSCGTRVCLGITSCPDQLPAIEHLDAHLANAHRELQRALQA